MNPVKYTEKSRINNQALPVSKGTISMMLNVKKKEDELIIPDFKMKVSKKSRFKIKWKTIQWLMDYKKGERIENIKKLIFVRGNQSLVQQL